MSPNDATNPENQSLRCERFGNSSVLVACGLLLAFLVIDLHAAQQKGEGLTLRPTQEITFTTDEGTWLSLDVASDGRTFVFDLAGHLYTLSAQGGEALPITQGLSFEAQPRFYGGEE
jgi:hypothetical protein